MADYDDWIHKDVVAKHYRWLIEYFCERDLSQYRQIDKAAYYESMMKTMKSHLESVITNVLEKDLPKEEPHYAKETEDDFNKYKELRIV